MESGKESTSIVDEKTHQTIQVHISLIRKVVFSFGGRASRNLHDSILYQISRYVFNNPLCLQYRLLSVCPSPLILPKVPYLLVKEGVDLCSKVSGQGNQSKTIPTIETSPKKSAYLSIAKRWKSIELQENNLGLILQKGNLFILFLENIKLYPLAWQQEDDSIDIERDFGSYESKKKQKSKSYHLVSPHLEQTHAYFSQILKYKKDKKLTQLVVKAFVHLMKKSMAFVKIQRNYNSQDLGCEQKYLYVQNQSKLPLTKRRGSNSDNYPALRVNAEGMWELVGSDKEGLTLLKEKEYPLGRGTEVLVSRKLNYFLQTDAWVEQLQ